MNYYSCFYNHTSLQACNFEEPDFDLKSQKRILWLLTKKFLFIPNNRIFLECPLVWLNIREMIPLYPNNCLL